MKIKPLITSFISAILMFMGSAFSEDSTNVKIGTHGIEIHGMIATENGQFVKSSYMQQIQLDRIWVNREYGQLYLKAAISDHLNVIVNPEVRLWYDTYTWQLMGNNAFSNPFLQHSTVSLAEAQGIFDFGDPDKIAYTFSAGVIPYKYDSDAKNLGEYLFRSGSRPSYILTAFDFAYARLTGLRLNSTINKNLSFDFFLTTETQVPPTLDWSISLLMNYKLPSLLDVGAGIMLDRVLPVKGTVETPVSSSNSYLTESGEQKYMSFGGTKLEGHISFDPKGLLPSDISGLFGKEDCKIYGEAAVLGLTNLTAYKWSKINPVDKDSFLVVDSSKNFYSDISKRIPVMFGFNVPTFKLFDYLSVELEWYGWPYPNAYGDVTDFKDMTPQPGPMQSYSKQDYIDDNWKYSFNLKKVITNGFTVIGQISRDHTHHEIYYHAYDDQAEVFTQKDQWGWWLKLQYNF